MTIDRSDLETPYLDLLLSKLDDNSLDHLGTLMLEMPWSSSIGRMSLFIFREKNLKGRKLIPAIVHDLSFVASHEADPRPSYRDILQVIAMRHNIADDGKQPASVVERQLQAKYEGQLRPAADTFKDLGSSEWYLKLAFGVPVIGWAAFMMSPDWRTATAVVLEVAALRRVALIREFAQELEL